MRLAIGTGDLKKFKLIFYVSLFTTQVVSHPLSILLHGSVQTELSYRGLDAFWNGPTQDPSVPWEKWAQVRTERETRNETALQIWRRK